MKEVPPGRGLSIALSESADPCDSPKRGELGRIIYGSGGLRSRYPSIIEIKDRSHNFKRILTPTVVFVRSIIKLMPCPAAAWSRLIAYATYTLRNACVSKNAIAPANHRVRP